MRYLLFIVGIVTAASFCGAQEKTSSPPQNERVKVVELTVTGASSLSTLDLEEARRSVVGKSGTLPAMLERARHSVAVALNGDCYIQPAINVESTEVGKSPERSLDVRVKVEPGVRFRLGSFRVEGTERLSAAEIEQKLPLTAMRQGDCHGLRSVQKVVTDLYRQV